MLNFIDSADVDAWLWVIKDKTLDPHYLPGFYDCFGGGKLAVLSVNGKPVVAQPFHQQSENWIGNAYNFGGPVGDYDLAPQFSNEFDLWKSEHGFNERCILNPTMRQVTGRADDLISRPVIYVDLNADLDIRATTRHTAQRAEKLGAKCELVERTHWNSSLFENLYNGLMKRNCAAPHWFYKLGFFNKVLNNLPGQSALFLTTVNGTVEAGCLLIWSPKVCYYHWAARSDKYEREGISHFQILNVIKWALDKGFQWLLLGGGLQPDDGLFKFKEGFSRRKLPCLSYVTYAQKVVVHD